jgi:DNA-binding NtrC family response regulator
MMKFTVLIVDDEEEMCLSLSELLTANNFVVIYTTDPLKVSSILNGHTVDLILLDITMPSMPGLDLLKVIKSKNPALPIIIIKVAQTDVPVLITGESGTGKELVACSIHYQSTRKNRQFIKVNCASIPDTLLESEIFGHEKGAFTDAVTRRIGKFELAHKGTIFFDEIGDMTAKTQPKLLRVIEDGEIHRLGGIQPVRTDVRVISATNRNIKQLISDAIFREDLYYRLSVVTIHLPPLRERKDDILLLANHFIHHFNRLYNKQIVVMNDEVQNLFMQHQWPGNIRELKNCIERAVIFSEKDETCLDIHHLPAQYRELTISNHPETFNDLYNTVSKEKILEALEQSNGIKQKAAEILNIHRKTLYNKIKKLGI